MSKKYKVRQLRKSYYISKGLEITKNKSQPPPYNCTDLLIEVPCMKNTYIPIKLWVYDKLRNCTAWENIRVDYTIRPDNDSPAIPGVNSFTNRLDGSGQSLVDMYILSQFMLRLSMMRDPVELFDVSLHGTKEIAEITDYGVSSTAQLQTYYTNGHHVFCKTPVGIYVRAVIESKKALPDIINAGSPKDIGTIEDIIGELTRERFSFQSVGLGI